MASKKEAFDIIFDFEHKLYNDNLQSIRLITNLDQRISTKLRHVDIQNLWSKQEFDKGRITVECIPLDERPADGLTKELPRGRFLPFRTQLDLTNLIPPQRRSRQKGFGSKQSTKYQLLYPLDPLDLLKPIDLLELLDLSDLLPLPRYNCPSRQPGHTPHNLYSLWAVATDIPVDVIT